MSEQPEKTDLRKRNGAIDAHRENLEMDKGFLDAGIRANPGDNVKSVVKKGKVS